MEVKAARADCVAPWERHFGLAASGHQGSEDIDGGAHLSDQVVIFPVERYCRYIYRYAPSCKIVLDRAAEPGQEFNHDVHVQDFGDI
ncbi:hypothetical protein GALL_464920 [mine drainage metagenome]|uniref:Uncharacterized protein n=1 Tax=mine drainage metagenome TaxID=410659 RepID=A0A1J5PL61_9ZZZZ